MHSGDVLRNATVFEVFKLVAFNSKVFRKLARAKKVEVQICQDEFELDAEEMQDIKDFSNFITKK